MARQPTQIWMPNGERERETEIRSVAARAYNRSQTLFAWLRWCVVGDFHRGPILIYCCYTLSASNKGNNTPVRQPVADKQKHFFALLRKSNSKAVHRTFYRAIEMYGALFISIFESSQQLLNNYDECALCTMHPRHLVVQNFSFGINMNHSDYHLVWQWWGADAKSSFYKLFF